MAGGPDVRALRYLLSADANGRRPVRCMGCPFDRPQCTSGHWRERARIELDLLECDNAVLAAVASDAREESSMYARGLAEGAAAEREACCKAVCRDCADTVPLIQSPGTGGWWHTPQAQWRLCRADAIRRRAEDDGR